jgi:glycosyltransferase involved in cell wall biosynthesis
MKKIVFVAGAYDACAWYRCHVPGVELKKRGYDVTLVVGRNLPVCEEADVVVFQRTTVYTVAQDMHFLRKKGKLVIYELDDDIWHLNPLNPGYWFWNHPYSQTMVIACLREADKVTTTTEPLAKILKDFNKNVFVLPNCLPDEFWNVNREKNKRVVVGWAGSNTHWNDLGILKGVVEQILNDFPDVEFYLAGMSRYPFDKHSRIKTLSSVKLEEYPDLIKNFDIGLAPLTDDHFNACKSDLKFIEYAALGIPTIASKVPAYKSTIKHGVNGFLARNAKDWLKFIRKLVAEKELRKRMGENARQYAKTRFISNNIWRWEKVFELN